MDFGEPEVEQSNGYERARFTKMRSRLRIKVGASSGR
jgi:hypothetical protein